MPRVEVALSNGQKLEFSGPNVTEDGILSKIEKSSGATVLLDADNGPHRVFPRHIVYVRYVPDDPDFALGS